MNVQCDVRVWLNGGVGFDASNPHPRYTHCSPTCTTLYRHRTPSRKHARIRKICGLNLQWISGGRQQMVKFFLWVIRAWHFIYDCPIARLHGTFHSENNERHIHVRTLALAVSRRCPSTHRLSSIHGMVCGRSNVNRLTIFCVCNNIKMTQKVIENNNDNFATSATPPPPTNTMLHTMCAFASSKTFRQHRSLFRKLILIHAQCGPMCNGCA